MSNNKSEEPDMKRRRTKDSSISNVGIDCGLSKILDLPDLILANIAKYLTKPSIPLFAIAVTPQASDGSSDASTITWKPTSTSNAIIGAYEERHTLDFEEIEESFAAKLTDDHIRDILVCIDAIHNLKVLKLTGCINIEGHGLDVLRGSLVLECIESHKPQLINDDNPPQLRLSPNIIISLLESIVESPGNKLQHMYFPDIIYNEDSRALVVNSNVIHVCNRHRTSRCGAIVKHHPSSRTERSRGRPECPYCECTVIEYLMSKGDCSRTRALEILELNDWDLDRAFMGLLMAGGT